MQYQIQEVEIANNSNRNVVASREGTFTEKDNNAWYGEVVASVTEKREGFQHYVVPENHNWFKHQDPNQSIGSATVDVSRPSTTKDPISYDNQVSFAEVAAAELKRNAIQRKENYEEQQRYKKAIAKLSSQ